MHVPLTVGKGLTIEKVEGTFGNDLASIFSGKLRLLEFKNLLSEETAMNYGWLHSFRLLGLFLLVGIPAAATDRVDQILIIKSAHTLILMNHGKTLKTYHVALGTVPVGPKVKHGDHRTPEGNYIIDGKNAHSEFHRALHLSYPNAADRQRAYKLGMNP